jgi:hypothetical protein
MSTSLLISVKRSTGWSSEKQPRMFRSLHFVPVSQHDSADDEFRAIPSARNGTWDTQI